MYEFLFQFQKNMCAIDVVESDPDVPDGSKAVITGNLGSPKNRIVTGRFVN